MRIDKEDIEFIKKTIKKYLTNSEIYIFGSRIIDNKKGGDIDIFIIPNKNLDIREKRILKRKIQTEIEDELFIPTDIIISKNLNRDIEKEAIKGIKIE